VEAPAAEHPAGKLTPAAAARQAKAADTVAADKAVADKADKVDKAEKGKLTDKMVKERKKAEEDRAKKASKEAREEEEEANLQEVHSFWQECVSKGIDFDLRDKAAREELTQTQYIMYQDLMSNVEVKRRSDEQIEEAAEEDALNAAALARIRKADKAADAVADAADKAAKIDEEFREESEHRGKAASVHKLPRSGLIDATELNQIERSFEKARKAFNARLRQPQLDFVKLCVFTDATSESRACLAEIDAEIGNKWPGMITAEHAYYLGLDNRDLLKARKQFRRESKHYVLWRSQGGGIDKDLSK
jgi:hypothetical protein